MIPPLLHVPSEAACFAGLNEPSLWLVDNHDPRD